MFSWAKNRDCAENPQRANALFTPSLGATCGVDGLAASVGLSESASIHVEVMRGNRRTFVPCTAQSVEHDSVDNRPARSHLVIQHK